VRGSGSFLERFLHPNDEAVAYDQAGHAVVAHVLGCRLVAVSVVPDALNPGRCEFEPPATFTVREWTRVGRGAGAVIRQATEGEKRAQALRRWEALRAVVRAAGAVAVARRWDERPRLVGRVAPTPVVDLDEANVYAMTAAHPWTEDRRWAFTRRATAAAQRRLGKPESWRAVRALAEALRTRRTLTGDQARTIIEEASGGRAA
jgi:hypothetical protein